MGRLKVILLNVPEASRAGDRDNRRALGGSGTHRGDACRANLCDGGILAVRANTNPDRSDAPHLPGYCSELLSAAQLVLPDFAGQTAIEGGRPRDDLVGRAHTGRHRAGERHRFSGAS